MAQAELEQKKTTRELKEKLHTFQPAAPAIAVRPDFTLNNKLNEQNKSKSCRWEGDSRGHKNNTFLFRPNCGGCTRGRTPAIVESQPLWPHAFKGRGLAANVCRSDGRTLPPLAFRTRLKSVKRMLPQEEDSSCHRKKESEKTSTRPGKQEWDLSCRTNENVRPAVSKWVANSVEAVRKIFTSFFHFLAARRWSIKKFSHDSPAMCWNVQPPTGRCYSVFPFLLLLQLFGVLALVQLL